MPKKKNTLIDASWWIGGNKNRGIGKYLEWYFLHELTLPVENRYWIFPKELSKKEKDDFSSQFPGEIVSLPIHNPDSTEKTYDALTALITQNNISNILVGSPFERPWALTAQFKSIKKVSPDITTSVVMHDLIPVMFPEKVLSVWPEKDQKEYLSYVKLLDHADTILCTSPFSQKQVTQYFPTAHFTTVILPFGTKTDWLTIPSNLPNINLSKKLAVTISGGEWRKNLAGTLKYFAQNLKDTHKLIVICKLGKKEKIKFSILALRLGIAHKVTFTSEIDEPTKWAYLTHCDIFLFLSLAEGLGIPLLEAKKAGVKNFVLSEELYGQGFGNLLDGCRVTRT